MKPFVLYMLLLIILVPASGITNELGITVRMPAEYELNCGERSDFSEQIFHNASARLDLDANLEIEIEAEETDTPATWWSFRQDLITTRDMFLVCHGATNGSLVLEQYIHTVIADSVYSAYLATFPNSEYFVKNWDGDAIFLTPAGISGLLTPGSDPNGNKLVFGCYSSVSKNSWGTFNDPYSGGSFFGYPESVPVDVACNDLATMTEIMACEDYFMTELDNSSYSAFSETSLQGSFFGNQQNYLNPAVQCKPLDIMLAAVEAWDGQIRFAVKNEERWSQYVIEGVDRLGDSPEILAVINGYGTDGEGVFRSYAVPVANYGHLRVVAYDNCCLTTVSDWIPWSEKSENWFLKPGDELSLLPIKAMAGGGYWDGRTLMANVKSRRNLVDPADVVVYTTTGNEPVASRIRTSWQVTQNPDGIFYRPRIFSGSENPEDVRNTYQAVHLANMEYNASHPDDPYLEFPILQIVGGNDTWVEDDETYRVGPDCFQWPDGENGGTANGIYSSYALMTDVDGDNIPDGPVVVVPLWEYAEAQIHADAVEAYNQSPFDSGVVAALDDYFSGVAAPWLEERAFGNFNAYTNARGLNLKGLLKVSDWLPSNEEDICDQMKAEGAAKINSGVSEVWYTGLSAGYSRHTWFLESVSDWTTAQGFLLFGPTCNFGGVDSPFPGESIKKEMFENLYGGIVVGGIGQLNGAFVNPHMKLSNLMQEMLPQMPSGTLVVEAAFAIQQEYLLRYPELHDYGLGIHCVGSVAKLKSASASFVPHEELAALSSFGLGAFVTGTGTSINFNLSKPVVVTLDIYDIRGARISTVFSGESFGSGEHSVTWNGRGSGGLVASGTYFAQLRVGNVSETVKFVVVK